MLRALGELEDGRKDVNQQREGARACELPGGDAHASQGSSREREDPLDIVGKPAVRQPEHGLRGVPEGNDVLRRAGEEEAQGCQGLVESGAGRVESVFYTHRRRAVSQTSQSILIVVVIVIVIVP